MPTIVPSMIPLVPVLAQFDTEEIQPATLITVCVVPTLIAVVLFFVFMKGELKGWAKTLKWVAMLPLIVGAFLGIGPMSAMNDELYRAQYGAGPRAKMLHYGGVVIPILAAIALVGLGIWHDRQKVDEI